jgi:hypothetical protein
MTKWGIFQRSRQKNAGITLQVTRDRFYGIPEESGEG